MPGEGPRLLNGERGSTLLWRDLAFYPPSDPVSSARRKARGFPISSRTLVFVPSIGLGYGLAELLGRLPEQCAVVCAEVFPEVMAEAIRVGLPRDPRIVVVRTEDPEALVAAVRAMGVGRFRRVVEAPLCAGYRLARQTYERMRQAIAQELAGYWRNRLTLTALGSRMVCNLLDNLTLLPEAGDIGDLGTELPVVVVGAGPSLDSTLEPLAPLRDRFALVAVDTAVPALAARSIVPDLIVALEAQASNLQDFIPARDPAPLLACELASHPSVARLYRGRLLFFSSAFAPLPIFDRLAGAGILPTPIPGLGSVGVCAAYLALRLTRGDVYLTGLDFSFPGGRTHARGTPYHLAMLHRCERVKPIGQLAYQAMAARDRIHVRGKDGASLQTDGVLRSYRDTLRRETAAEARRIIDIGDVGMDLDLRAVSVTEAAGRLKKSARGSGFGVSGRGSADASRRERFDGRRIQEFLRAERDLLVRASEAARQAASNRIVDPACAELIRAVQHAWVHFPDDPDPAEAGPSFLARASVASGYYANRADRLCSLLGGLEDGQEG